MTDVDPCLRAAQLMHQFLDQELDEGTAMEIRRHLDACEACVGSYDVEVVVRSTLKRCCCEQAPQDLRARIVHLRLQRG